MQGGVPPSTACDGRQKPRVAKGKIARPKVEKDEPHRRGRRPKSMRNASRPMRNATLVDTRRPADHLRIRGAGPTLSYEVVDNGGVWRTVARELRDFRCVLLDLRGVWCTAPMPSSPTLLARSQLRGSSRTRGRRFPRPYPTPSSTRVSHRWVAPSPPSTTRSAESMRSFVTEGLRRVDGGVRPSRGREHSDLSRRNCGSLE